MFTKTAVSYLKHVSACNNQQMLFIIPHGPPWLGRQNSLINSPTELQYSVLSLSLKVPREQLRPRHFLNLSCNVLLAYYLALRVCLSISRPPTKTFGRLN
jgi:hypothetical protein